MSHNHFDEKHVLHELKHYLPTQTPLKDFILPGGNRGGVSCHLARTVCRRSERRLVHLHQTIPQRPEVLRYINRLSDLLFVLARVLNRETGQEVVYWQKPD